jgi:glyoxylase-like metal-dependent hydrolase (beta-lactamase superfamily II)
MLEALTVGPIGERCYLLPMDREDSCILVDPGDEAGRILDLLGKRALTVAYIVLTHGHLDHTAAIPDLLAALAAKGERPLLAIHAADAHYLGAEAEDSNRRVFTAIRATGYFRHYWRPLPAADLILEEGQLVPGSAWKVIHTPGHTAGSICLYNEGLGILVAGDTLFESGVGRTDGPDSNPAALAASITEKLFSLPGETAVLPGHGEATTIGRERGEA